MDFMSLIGSLLGTGGGGGDSKWSGGAVSPYGQPQGSGTQRAVMAGSKAPPEAMVGIDQQQNPRNTMDIGAMLQMENAGMPMQNQKNPFLSGAFASLIG
jgi:hypothetical protein